MELQKVGRNYFMLCMRVHFSRSRKRLSLPMTEEAAATAASTDVLRPPEVAISEESWYSTDSRERASIMALAALQS